jgi:prevent-host-death family protein
MVTVTQFKAKCLGIITAVERDKRPVSITKNGRVAVRVVPATETGSEDFFGRGKKSTVICGDLLGTGEHWDAEH